MPIFGKSTRQPPSADKDTQGSSSAIVSEGEHHHRDDLSGTLRPIVEDDFEMIDGNTEGADFGAASPNTGRLETPSGFISGSTRGTTMAQLDNPDDDLSIRIAAASDAASYKGADEDEVDEMCLRQSVSVMFETDYQKMFECFAIEKYNGGSVHFKIRGRDDRGPWVNVKRYSDFEELRKNLKEKWFCVPIPIMPEKHSIIDKLWKKKKNDDSFLEERKYLLNRFLKQLADYEFIINSEEFKAFSRSTRLYPMQNNNAFRLKDFRTYLAPDDISIIEMATS